jgi:sorbitol-6-phosphate 2-dehydrogenase
MPAMSIQHQRLTNRKAIVTGAAQGLGRALGERLAREGCAVALMDLKADAIQATAAEIAAATNANVAGFPVDVTDEEYVQEAFYEAHAHLGGLDILVSNAGIVISGETTSFEVGAWRRVLDVNLVGYFLCAREAVRYMLRDKTRGSIVQINSKSGKKGSFRNSAYAASKFGGIGLTQSLALEYAEAGIRVNAICPGNLLDSPLWKNELFGQYAKNQGITEEEVREKYIQQVPMRRSCAYDDVANVVVFLASEESSYMTGQALNVTGGQEMR